MSGADVKKYHANEWILLKGTMRRLPNDAKNSFKILTESNYHLVIHQWAQIMYEVVQEEEEDSIMAFSYCL